MKWACWVSTGAFKFLAQRNRHEAEGHGRADGGAGVAARQNRRAGLERPSQAKQQPDCPGNSLRTKNNRPRYWSASSPPRPSRPPTRSKVSSVVSPMLSLAATAAIAVAVKIAWTDTNVGAASAKTPGSPQAPRPIYPSATNKRFRYLACKGST